MRLKFKFWQLLKILYLATCNVLVYLMLCFVLYGLVLFRKGDLRGVNVSWMIFEGGILDGM